MAVLSPVCTSKPDAYDLEHWLRRLVLWRRGGEDIAVATHTVLPFGSQLSKTYHMIDKSVRAHLETDAVPARVRTRFVDSGFASAKLKLGGLLFYAKEKGLGVLALTCKACNAGEPPAPGSATAEPRESSALWWEHWEDQHHPKMQQQQNKYGQGSVDGDLMSCEVTTTSTQLLDAAADGWDGSAESAPHSLLWAVLVLFLKAPYAMRLAATSTGRRWLEELHRAAKAGQQRPLHEQCRQQEARFAVTGMGGEGSTAATTHGMPAFSVGTSTTARSRASGVAGGGRSCAPSPCTATGPDTTYPLIHLPTPAPAPAPPPGGHHAMLLARGPGGLPTPPPRGTHGEERGAGGRKKEKGGR